MATIGNLPVTCLPALMQFILNKILKEAYSPTPSINEIDNDLLSMLQKNIYGKLKEPSGIMYLNQLLEYLEKYYDQFNLEKSITETLDTILEQPQLNLGSVLPKEIKGGNCAQVIKELHNVLSSSSAVGTPPRPPTHDIPRIVPHDDNFVPFPIDFAPPDQDPHSAAKEPIDWSIDDVGKWLDQVGWSRYRPKFLEQEIDGKALLLIVEKQLKEDFDVKIMGHRLKLWDEIQKLKKPK